MNIRQKLFKELELVGSAMFFFACWIAMLVAIKNLVLAEYHIAPGNISAAVVGVMVLGKVVVVLQRISLGQWIRVQPAWVDVVVRSVLYALGVFIVLVLEKAFEGRHEYAGFVAALSNVFEHADMPHVWANTVCLFGGLLVYNVMSIIRRYYPDSTVLRILMRPLPDTSPASEPER